MLNAVLYKYYMYGKTRDVCSLGYKWVIIVIDNILSLQMFFLNEGKRVHNSTRYI